jgi:hypothetical protein
MHVKLGFVFFAFVSLYHSQMPSDIQTVAKWQVKYTTNFVRLWRLGATIYSLPSCFLVVLKMRWTGYRCNEILHFCLSWSQV